MSEHPMDFPAALIPAHSPRSTIKDVARDCGVSVSAVSKAMNMSVERSRIHPDTRRRILDSAERLNYTPSWRARALVQGRSNSVGLLYAQPYPFISGMAGMLIRYLADHLNTCGYRMQFVPLLGDVKSWRPLLIDQQIDGFVVMGEVPPELGSVVSATGSPTVLINSDAPALHVPQIQPDDYQGAIDLTLHFYAQGHRDILFFRDTKRFKSSHFSIARRLDGYTKAMAETGGVARPLNDTSAALADRIASGEETCTAVIVYDETDAMLLLGALLRRGVRVPGRISVATFSDSPMLEMFVPSITCMRLPTQAMSQAAGDLLIQRMERRGSSGANSGEWISPQLFTETLTVRESTAPPSG